MTASCLRLPKSSDPAVLFPMVFGTEVVETIRWDGPTSLDAFAMDWARTSAEVKSGKRHFFVIEPPELGKPIGCCDVRPYEEAFRGDVGLWIGMPFQGKGYGTSVVRELCDYAFGKLGMAKLEARVFVGNWPSRHIFEKNGFELEGTIRAAIMKRGQLRDEWYLGLLNPLSLTRP